MIGFAFQSWPNSGRHAQPQADGGRVDLPAQRKASRRYLLVGQSKLESTVSYLGIEVDEALIFSELPDI